MRFRIPYLYIFVVSILMLLGMVSKFQSSYYRNKGLLKLVKISCDSNCEHYPLFPAEHNNNDLQIARKNLEKALIFEPDSINNQLHLAEALFSQGLYTQGSELVKRTSQIDSFVSPILIPGRYENYILLGEQMYMSGNWKESVINLNIGLALAGEALIPLNNVSYYQAFESLYREKIIDDPDNIENKYLLGILLGEIGEWYESEIWLKQINSPDIYDYLTDTQVGQLLTYLGRAAEYRNDRHNAQRYYELAIDIVPNWRDSYVRLLSLLQRQGDDDSHLIISSLLNKLGPTYIVGAETNGYQHKEPGLFSDGWRLVGYDLNPESLESRLMIDLTLWWMPPKDYQENNEKFIKNGEYFLESRILKNLVVNPGFEFGLDASGLPRGNYRNVYETPIEYLQVERVNRFGSLTNVFVTRNYSNDSSVGLAGHPQQLDPKSYYLMGGWIWRVDNKSNIGRSCWLEEPNSPYYIVDDNIIDSKEMMWTHVVDFTQLYPGKAPTICEIFLINFQSENKAMWDNLIFFEITHPLEQ